MSNLKKLAFLIQYMSDKFEIQAPIIKYKSPAIKINKMQLFLVAFLLQKASICVLKSGLLMIT